VLSRRDDKQSLQDLVRVVCVLLNCFTWLTAVVAVDVEGGPEVTCYEVLSYEVG